MTNKSKTKRPAVESDYKQSALLEIKNKLVSELMQFDFLRAIYIVPHARHRRTKAKLLQEDIHKYLNERMPNYKWQMEYTRPDSERKDRIDIFGESPESNLKIIIELDGTNANQVAKKFLSRSALFLEENLLYVSLCYPNTEKNTNECLKYFEYCKVLSEFISQNTSVAKLYVGHFLELKK